MFGDDVPSYWKYKNWRKKQEISELEPVREINRNKKFGCYLLEGTKGKLKGKYKLGVTGEIETRVSNLEKQFKTRIIVLHFIRCDRDHVYILESTLHKIFKRKRVIGEWFELDQVDITKIKSIRSRQLSGRDGDDLEKMLYNIFN